MKNDGESIPKKKEKTRNFATATENIIKTHKCPIMHSHSYMGGARLEKVGIAVHMI